MLITIFIGDDEDGTSSLQVEFEIKTKYFKMKIHERTRITRGDILPLDLQAKCGTTTKVSRIRPSRGGTS
jgi:hypothetical protein